MPVTMEHRYIQNVFQDTLTHIQDSVAAANPWIVANDEQGRAVLGVAPDSADSRHDIIRRDILWGNIMVRFLPLTRSCCNRRTFS